MWNSSLETRKFLMPSTRGSEGFAVLWRSCNNLASLLASLSLFYAMEGYVFVAELLEVLVSVASFCPWFFCCCTPVINTSAA